MKRFTVLLSLSILGLVFLCRSAHALTLFTNKTDFLNALSDYSIIDFEDYSLSAGQQVVITGNEYSGFGVTFDSPLASPLGQLYVQSPSFPYYSSNFLSVDREPFAPGNDGNEDDMIFDITTIAYAFGVSNIVDNAGGPSESITVHGNSGVIYTQNSIPDFFGILADEPITQVFFDEKDFNGDDIGYDNIVIGNTQPIPEPGAILLIGTGLVGLAAFRRRFKK